VVIGWLTRLTVTLAVLGVLLFDGAALLVGRVSTADNADTAAQAAADAYSSTHSYKTSLLAAQTAAGADEVVPNSLRIAPDGSTAVALHRSLSTLVVRHVPHLEDLASVTETGRGRAPLN
jgi:hypothetical protein